MIKRICAKCGILIPYPDTYCNKCKRKNKQSANKNYDNQRKIKDAKYISFYKSNLWKQLRLKKLQDAEYQCEECRKENIFTIAEEVHHIISIKENFNLRLEYNNLCCLCKRHHNIKHGKFS